ncbi:MAG: TonB-dependent receptor [Proteobacteria bacterium]|nr:TonB-dependent receptor [Pseudomonadota bacterium]
MKSSQRAWSSCSVAALSLAVPAIALAADDAVLEEVVVTAQKRTERLIDVPMSITAISGDDVIQRGLNSVQDLAFAVPGMATREDGPGSYTIFMRGLSNQYGNGALVSLYEDEAPLTLTGFDQMDVRPLDIERVEVLKGPQGTLYGQGAVAGAIRYITRDPVLDAYQGSVEASLATVDGGSGKWTETGIVNLPVVENVLGVRLAVTKENGGGWQDQPQAGIFNGNGQDLINARFKALWKPTDALTVKAMVSAFHDETRLGLGYENPDHTVPVAVDPARVLIPKKFGYNLYNLDVIYDFSWAELLSSSTYIHHEHRYPFSYFGGPETIYQGALEGTDARSVEANQFTEEVRLSSRGTGPFHWTVGGFYRNLHDDLFALYDTLYAGALFSNLTYTTNDKYDQVSLFGDASYQLTHRWQVGVGARYFRDDTSEFDGTTTQWGRFHSTDPRGYTSYKITDNVNVYGSVSKGFRSGGFNLSGQPSYGPESLISYELGSKGSLAGNTVNYEIAGYYSDYSNMLRRGLILADNAGAPTLEQLTSNVGTVHIYGVEGGITWRATRKLTLNTTASWIHSRIVSVNATDATNIAGDQVDYVPKFAFTAGVNYDIHWTSKLPGFIRLDYSYRDKVDYVDRTSFPAENLPQTSDAISVLDGRMGATWGNATCEIYGTNLTNENRWVDPYHAWSNANRTRPRTVGIKIGYQFN